MRKLDGFSLLTISICLCIFVSLGYVKLFHGVSQRVNRADTADFWQIRTVAIKLRNPAREARQAFSNGDINGFDIGSITESSDHKVVELTLANVGNSSRANKKLSSQASMGFGSWLGGLLGSGENEQTSDWFESQDHAVALASSHQAFIDARSDFAFDYNRELTQLINQR